MNCDKLFHNKLKEGDLIYSIGEFAKLSKVSPRMLRHYDKIGLFKPSHTGENGYRYYGDEDIYQISDIKQLRKYEFSLEEIDKMIKNNDAEYTKMMLKQKIDALRQAATGYNHLIVEMERQVRTVRGKESLLSANTSFDILMGYRKEFLALCQRRRTSEDKIDEMIYELYLVIENSKSMAVMGTHMTIFHQDYNIYAPDNTDLEVCIPVNMEWRQGEVQTRLVKGGFYISTIFMGSYERIGTGYIALLKWAKENNYKIAGPTVERYYRDCRETGTEDEFITEICIPVNSD